MLADEKRNQMLKRVSRGRRNSASAQKSRIPTGGGGVTPAPGRGIFINAAQGCTASPGGAPETVRHLARCMNQMVACLRHSAYGKMVTCPALRYCAGVRTSPADQCRSDCPLGGLVVKRARGMLRQLRRSRAGSRWWHPSGNGPRKRPACSPGIG